MKRPQVFFQAAAVALLCVSCATKPLERPKSIEESQSELPPELQKLKVEAVMKKFEPTPAPTPVAKGKKSKKGKKDLTPAPEPTPNLPSSKTGFVIKSRRPENGREPFPIGESMTWNVGYLGFSAGTASIKVESFKYINNRKVYHLEGSAKSSAIMNLFYSLDDKIDTFIDYEGLFTHRFHLQLDETKQKRDAVEIHDIEKMNVFWWSRLNHSEKGFEERKENAPIQPYSQDTLSALYYLRTVPFTDGTIIKLPLVSEAKTLDAEVTILRHEECGTPLGKRNCVVLKPETKFQGILQKTADSFIWITDDNERMVIRIEAHVKIGSVSVSLEKYEPGQP